MNTKTNIEQAREENFIRYILAGVISQLYRLIHLDSDLIVKQEIEEIENIIKSISNRVKQEQENRMQKRNKE